MKIGYIRVSTLEQNLDRQKLQLNEYGVDKIFQDQASGKDFDRPGFTSMNKFVREGDTIVVSDWSRLGRSTIEVINIIDDFKLRGIRLISIKENIDTNTSQGKFMLTVIAAFNEMERELIKERQHEGIQIAKTKGVYKGRQKIDKPKNFDQVYDDLKNRKISLNQALALTGLKRSTFYKFSQNQDD